MQPATSDHISFLHSPAVLLALLVFSVALLAFSQRDTYGRRSLLGDLLFRAPPGRFIPPIVYIAALAGIGLLNLGKWLLSPPPSLAVSAYLQPLEDQAAAGNEAAQRLLGLEYQTGSTAARNDREAEKWYRRAASQGDAEAACLLGMLYATGAAPPVPGPRRDDVEAGFWLTIAANRGQSRCATTRDRVIKYLTPRQAAAVKTRVAAWRPKMEKQAPAPARGERTPAVAGTICARHSCEGRNPVP